MEEVIRFALLGLGIGATYALASQGLIIIYRGSGVLNFALGAIGMAGAYVWWELTTNQGWAFLPGLVAGVAFAAVIGALVHLFIMRPLRNSAPLVRVIATLGVLITIQSIAILRYTATSKFVPSDLPTDIVHIHNTIVISADRLILLGIAIALTAALWLFYRYTKFGLSTAAVAESERSASALGLSPDTIATLNWALGCGLAGLAAILIVPIVTLQPAVLTNLVLAATAAALVAGFRSFPIALVAGLVVGIAQTEVTRYVSQTGVGTAVPFILIVIWLVIRGQALPLRDYLLQRLPTIGTGRIHKPGLAFGVVLGAVLLSIMSPIWIDAITVTICVAVILLSIVVLTGYTGQLSLAQFAFAGFGAWVGGRLLATTDLPFWLGCMIGIVATVPLGILFGLPAVRTRGINLAIVTLGLGSAVELVLFGNTDYTGGFGGTQIGDPTLFGLNVNAASHPTRYGLLALSCLVVATLVVANLRRGRAGRRLIAVRTNERAAAALGISVPGAKLYAFAVASAIAGLGGILLAFRSSSINYAVFASFTSITMVAYAMIGGIGYLLGPVIGATLAPGAFSERLLNEIDSGIGKYIPLIGGVALIVLLLVNQNGDRQGADRPDRLPAPEAGRDPALPGAEGARAAGAAGGQRRRYRGREEHGARGQEPDREIRRHDRGRRRLADRQAGPGGRPDRPQRRRQDLADRRRHRLHQDERRLAAAARRHRHQPLVGDAPRAGRDGPLLPVAGAVRGLDRARQPARRLGPARLRLLRARPGLAGQRAVARLGAGDDPRVRTRRRPRPHGRGPALRAPAPAGDGAGGRDPVQRAAARRAGRRPRRRRDRRARRTWSAAWRRSGGSRCCSSSTT